MAVAVRSSMKDNVPFDKRVAESRRILGKYPERVPVICERAARSDLPEIDKKKFLVPGSMTCGGYKHIIGKHIEQSRGTEELGRDAECTIYVFVKDNKTPKTGSTMADIYEEHKDEDGFLYMTYSAEATLG
mmetsp:Transcript_43207/g.92443  ORF Transcript_43207/g.92443 Transcript_43207/m.92443 type:complete len:131 (+) Transcript_43207:70-462(+)|eukprot:CAMPEP_0206484632 /NCGR_PEP_ID=MMETSP0324_2-20121206/40083_1 /ASSEMBLY_ACC=CAM_ASM_000836 /TAXON_ID=2866 /ORGANISM="Crypthecodinium cohnii, Strain Seligo" /LENGTH=130 /DNA_ID=CAMNT_0053962803 /DNA_START=54 /DNA_END=449 /DNA_ORIENTATION=-